MEDYKRFSSAVDDFRQARRQAAVQEVLGRITGRSQKLIAFEEMRKQVGQDSTLQRGLQDIELDSIVGSVGRYEDFNRQFMPIQESQKERWARVRMMAEKQGMPPIEVFQLGEVYFVSDGHHRVSVARQVGAKTIQAYVTEVPSKAPLKPEDDADVLILKAEETRFMGDTHLDQTRPDIHLGLTSAGRYRELREHIAVHQYYMGLEGKREISLEDAAADWVDKVYSSAIGVIRRKGLLRDFPDRTEGDLYLWLMQYRNELGRKLGWELETDEAAEELSEQFSLRVTKVVKRLRLFLRERVTPVSLERGPAPGEWRAGRGAGTKEERIFRRILVGVSGEDRSWGALDQAIRIAKREGGKVRGLHIQREGEREKTLRSVRKGFEERIKEAGIEGKLVVEKGEVSKSIERRSRWSDLAVLHLLHPPGDKPADRLRSGLRELIQRIPRPLMLVARSSHMEHALLAFDGSRKSKEALYLAAYVAKTWKIKLTVFSGVAGDEKEAIEIQEEAMQYLADRGVETNGIAMGTTAKESLLKTAKKNKCDLILMGGYGAAPLVEVVIGSTVDLVLREFKGPVLICR
jgi:nucleotide-binding universal stress UspA family protein